jgi:hypothetical protein
VAWKELRVVGLKMYESPKVKVCDRSICPGLAVVRRFEPLKTVSAVKS